MKGGPAPLLYEYYILSRLSFKTKTPALMSPLHWMEWRYSLLCCITRTLDGLAYGQRIMHQIIF